MIKEGISFSFVHETRNLINQARNRSAHYAINNGYDKILFIDADIIFKPEHVMALLKSKRRIVGGAYPLKGFPIKLNFVPNASDEDRALNKSIPIEEFIKQADENGEVEVFMLPGGFMCIDVSVFKDLEPFVEKYHHRDPLTVNKENELMFFPFDIAPDGFLYTEDWNFCHLIRTHLKDKLYWNTRAIVDHAGHYVYSAFTDPSESYKKINIHEKVELVDNPFNKWPRNLYCYCGSGKKFKHCHESKLFDKVSRQEADKLIPEYKRLVAYVQDRYDKNMGYKLIQPVL